MAIRPHIALMGPRTPRTALSAIKELAHVSIAVTKNKMPIKSTFGCFIRGSLYQKCPQLYLLFAKTSGIVYNDAMELFSIRNFILIILIVVGINYYKSRQEVDVQSLSLPLDTKILAFGDSLTFGYGAPRDKSYPSVLVDLLHVTVINEGVSGELSAEGLARFPSVLERHKPDILILCHGANDILRKKDLSQTKANLNEMIRLAKDKGVYVLLVGVPTYDILNFNVASMYYDVAKENNIEIEDKSLKTIFDNEATLKSDKVHPNEQGYDVMAKNIARLLSENYHPSAKSF